MSDQAIHPDTPVLEAEPIQEEEQQYIDTTIDQEKELASLLYSKGWDQLTKMMKEDIEKFKTGAFITDIEKQPLEKVGQLFVIHQTVASELEKYLTKVEDAAKAVSEHERRKLS